MEEFHPSSVEQLRQLHPADLADHLQRLPVATAQSVLQQLPCALAAATIVELEKDKAHEILASFTTGQLLPLLQALPPNEIADLVGSLPPPRRRELLAALPAEHAAAVRALLRYPENSAGGIMSNRFIVLREDMTVEQAREQLRAHGQEESTGDIAYLYVTDPARRLVGIVSLRDLVFRRAERRMSEIMNRSVKCVHVDMDQEELARQFEHYHYLGLPVLDVESRLVGVVKASDALAIAQKEATEDMQLMVGLSGEERALTPWRKAVGKRLPWLLVNLGTALLAAAVVACFESTIARWTALAVFLPIIAGQGGNAGMQTLTVIIRALALKELSPGDGRKALAKEILLGLVNGVVIGLVVGVIGYWWQGSLALGLVAAAAMLLNQLAAAASGVLIPLGLRLCRVDPALASSIFLTTVTDVAGFLFFLGLAALVIR